jgi:hypothetical protein
MKVYPGFIQYYLADELAGTNTSALIDLQGAQGAVSTHTEAIAVAYGTAMHAHHTGAPNAALDAAAAALQVNEYAVPQVGEGIVTQRLGETVHGTVQDPYNARVENAPGEATLWRFHWGGVVASDGTDYITLENYARKSEDNLGDTGSDPRFYFQMYGSGAQSWHEQWATVHAGTRNFANPISFRVTASQPDNTTANLHYGHRAGIYFSGAAVADDYNTVGTVTNVDRFGVLLYKAIAFANHPAVGDRSPTGASRTQAWLTAINGFAGQPFYTQVGPLRHTAVARLVQQLEAKFDLDAQNQWGATVETVKDDYGMIATAHTSAAAADQIRKGLAYANHHITGGRKGTKDRVRAWQAAVGRAMGGSCAQLAQYTLQRLAQVKT